MTPKTWFVTGASRGLGRVWTQAALKRGDKVAATARNPETLADLVDTFRLFGKLWVTQAALPYLREQESDAAPRTYTMPPPAKRWPAGPAEARNWEVAATLSDLDAFAYQPRARRPGFETLITEAATRSADGVLVWKLDRLVRDDFF